MSNKKTILAISGSTRKSSTNNSILQFLKKEYSAIFTIEIFDSIGQLPHFNSDLLENKLPKTIAQFRNKIALADAILFCTPEYVYALPGSLKNIIDWNVSTTLFSGKPVGYIVAAASGQKAFDSLNLILETLEAIVPEQAKLLISGARSKINSEGAVTDTKLLTAFDSCMASLSRTIDQQNISKATLRL